MYLVVNESLSMGKGKVAGQVGHAVSAMVRRMERGGRSEAYRRWVDGLETKIVVRAPSNVFLKLCSDFPAPEMTLFQDSPKGSFDVFGLAIRDAAKTQIPADSLTVLVFPPLDESLIPSELKMLKLL